MGTLLREYFEGAGTRFLLESNVPLPLDDPDCAVLVLGGKAEIFAQRFQGGRPTEARIHLHTARPGDVLFGTSKSDEGLRLLAAGNLESHAVKLPFAELENQARKSPAFAEELRRNAERFISGTGAGTAAEIIPRPRINLDAESGASVLLDGSSVVAPRTGTVWVSKTRGTPPMFLGQEELILPEKLFFPLPSSCWITGAGESSLDFSDTSAVVNQGSLTASLSIWFSTLFSCLEFNHRMGLVDTLNLLEEKRTGERIPPQPVSSPSGFGAQAENRRRVCRSRWESAVSKQCAGLEMRRASGLSSRAGNAETRRRPRPVSRTCPVSGIGKSAWKMVGTAPDTDQCCASYGKTMNRRP